MPLCKMQQAAAQWVLQAVYWTACSVEQWCFTGTQGQQMQARTYPLKTGLR